MNWDTFTTEFMNIEWWRLLFRLMLAVLCGGVLGLEREVNRHPAGLRTHIIVCLGSTLVMITGQGLTIAAVAAGLSSDPARLGAQVISGIGFLGAGTIIVTGKQHIKGLTTAAGLWASACIGLAIGCGFWAGALVSCALILFVFTIFNKFDQYLMNSMRALKCTVTVSDPNNVADIIENISQCRVTIKNIQIQRSEDIMDMTTNIMLTLSSKTRRNHADILAEISALKGVISVMHD